MKTLVNIVTDQFDDAKAELERDGFSMTSLEENAKLRIWSGKNSHHSQHGNYTKEGFIYVPKSNEVILVKHSPALDFAEEATNAHRKSIEYFLSDEQVEKLLDNSIRISYDIRPIPTNRFKDYEVTVYVFGRQAAAYGEFLKDAEINEMPILFVPLNYIDSKKAPFVRQIWFHKLDRKSTLDGNYLNFTFPLEVLGIREINESNRLLN